MFREGPGCMKGIEGKLFIENEMPIFYKASSVPYAIKERVEMKIERLKKEKVIIEVVNSDGLPL